MIDVYGIGVTLKLTDMVGPQLINLAKQFEKIDLLAISLNKSLRAVGSNTAGLKALNVETGMLDTKLERANQQAILLERNLRGLKAAGMVPGVNTPLPGVVPGLGGSGGRGGHRGGGGLHGGNIHMGSNGVGIGSVGMGLGSGALVPLVVAGATLYIGHGLYEEAKKLEKARADFGNLNLSKAENAEVLKKSRDLTSDVHGTKVTENMALIQDLHTATGDLHHAVQLAGPYAVFANAAKIQNSGKNVDGLVLNSIKALEHRGDPVMQNQAELDKELRMQSQVHFFTKGVVSPTDYYAMSRTGKLAYQLASPEYLYGPAAALISANSGATAGTMEMTALSSLVGGHMDKKAKGFLIGLGLWQDQVDPKVAEMRKRFDKDPEYQKIVAANGGNLIQTGGLSAENSKLFVEDRNKFVLDILMPAIKKKYGLDMSNEDVARLLSGNFNRNTSADLSFFVTNQMKVAKDTAGIRKSKDYTDANAMYMNTAVGAEENFVAAWTNFKTEFGSNVLPVITSVLNDGATILRNISEFKQKFFPSSDSAEGEKSKDKGLTPAWKLPGWPWGNDEKKPEDDKGVQAGNVYLDGQKVGYITGKYIAKDMSKPPTGPNFFDASMSPRPVGGK
jgi:hypothetical protein